MILRPIDRTLGNKHHKTVLVFQVEHPYLKYRSLLSAKEKLFQLKLNKKK